MSTPDLNAQLADRYRIVGFLGAGGMATAGLQHPHIRPLLDSGDTGTQVYYVMPLVEGETLRARLERERQLPVAETIRLLRQIADALQYAHDQGIIHRDIKPPGARLESVAAFAAALDQVDAPAEGLSIVVLPFANLGPDPDRAYFADGLTDEVISDLSKVRALRVIARNSAMQLPGTTKDSATIARELNARYVLEGSVRKAGNALRLGIAVDHGFLNYPLFATIDPLLAPLRPLPRFQALMERTKTLWEAGVAEAALQPQ